MANPKLEDQLPVWSYFGIYILPRTYILLVGFTLVWCKLYRAAGGENNVLAVFEVGVLSGLLCVFRI